MADDRAYKRKTDGYPAIITDWATMVNIINRNRKELELEYEFSNGRKFYRRKRKKQ